MTRKHWLAGLLLLGLGVLLLNTMIGSDIKQVFWTSSRSLRSGNNNKITYDSTIQGDEAPLATTATPPAGQMNRGPDLRLGNQDFRTGSPETRPSTVAPEQPSRGLAHGKSEGLLTPSSGDLRGEGERLDASKLPRVTDPVDSDQPPSDHNETDHSDNIESYGEREGKKRQAFRGNRRDARQKRKPRQRAMPRSFYFENTYLGGDAAAAERLRRLDAAWAGGARQPYRLACLDPQPFDAPASHGMALDATLDRRSLDKPGRVLLQVGLRGSTRVGWRRPPLDVVAVVCPSAVGVSAKQTTDLALALVRRLGPQDRLGIVVAGNPVRVLAVPDRLRRLRGALARTLGQLAKGGQPSPDALAQGLATAGQLLARIAGRGGIPGTQTILLVTGQADPARVLKARVAAHGLAVASVVTSVVQLGPAHAAGDWWAVAAAGQGQYHRLAPGAPAGQIVDAELDGLSRVVARLLRINIRLAPHVRCMKVLGSRMLARAEVKRVKAREEATDRQLSRTLGVTSDRGKDDDGIQTVIPYFKGGDAHVILLELQVDKPGPVAEVSLKYKDMVRLTNAQIHTSASLAASPRRATPREQRVTDNAADFGVAGRLRTAAVWLRRGNWHQARAVIGHALRSNTGHPVLVAFENAMRRGGRHGVLADALELAADRMVGQPSDG